MRTASAMREMSAFMKDSPLAFFSSGRRSESRNLYFAASSRRRWEPTSPEAPVIRTVFMVCLCCAILTRITQPVNNDTRRRSRPRPIRRQAMQAYRLFAFLAALGLLCSPPAAAQQNMILKASDVHPLGYPTVEAIQRMGKKLE